MAKCTIIFATCAIILTLGIWAMDDGNNLREADSSDFYDDLYPVRRLFLQNGKFSNYTDNDLQIIATYNDFQVLTGTLKALTFYTYLLPYGSSIKISNIVSSKIFKLDKIEPEKFSQNAQGENVMIHSNGTIEFQDPKGNKISHKKPIQVQE